MTPSGRPRAERVTRVVAGGVMLIRASQFSLRAPGDSGLFRASILGLILVAATALAGCNQIDAEPVAIDEEKPDPVMLAEAEAGDPAAQLGVGRFFAEAASKSGSEESNERARYEAEAARWLTLAAEQDVAEAQLEIGVMLAESEGPARNIAEAQRWLSRAGAAGQPSAFFVLGEIAMAGEDEAPNPKLAVAYFQRAEAKGHRGAMHRLAEAYEEGLGVDPDLDAAIDLYRKASDAGYAL